MINIKPKIGVDIDDTLYRNNSHACQLANEEYGFSPPLTIDEITSWGPRGDRSDIVIQYYLNPEFVRTQPIMEGAKEFINELMQIADVYLITAIDPSLMGIRMERLLTDFPELPKENIIMGYQKNLIHVDFLLDDNPNNIIHSSAKYPVIFRKPWNKDLHNYLSVGSYDEFISLVKHIQEVKPPKNKKFIILYGPSASGKTAIMKKAGIPIVGSVTTRLPRDNDVGYQYMTEEEFLNQDLLEHSVYAGKYYGTLRSEVDNIPGRAIKAMDLAGALNTRLVYDDCVLVFVKRRKEDVVKSILERDVPMDDKVRRICSLDQEYANEKFADFILENDGTLDDTVEKLNNYLM